MSEMKAWIEERWAIHSKGTGVLLRNPYELNREYDLWDEDAEAIADAHNNLPRALDALNAVGGLHRPVHQVFSWQAGGTTAHDPCKTCHGKAGKPGDYECGCWGDRDLVYTCAECRDDKGRDIDWPCPTVQAIEGAIND